MIRPCWRCRVFGGRCLCGAVAFEAESPSDNFAAVTGALREIARFRLCGEHHPKLAHLIPGGCRCRRTALRHPARLWRRRVPGPTRYEPQLPYVFSGMPCSKDEFYNRDRCLIAAFPTNDDLTLVEAFPNRDFRGRRGDLEAHYFRLLTQVPDLRVRVRGWQTRGPVHGHHGSAWGFSQVIGTGLGAGR